MTNLPEKDWKRLWSLQDKALATACERILSQVEMILQDRQGKEQAAYLALWKLLQ